MSDKISQKIDSYALSHLTEFRRRETGSLVRVTKEDVALEMYQKGLLSASDYSLWLSSAEYQSSSRDRSLSIWGVPGEDGYLDSLGDSFERTTPPIPQVIPVTPSEQPQVSNASSEMQENAEIRESVVENLLSNARNAQAMIEQYHDSIGYISSDAVVQGVNVIGDASWDLLTRRNDFVTVFENEDAMSNEIAKLEELKSKAGKPNEFKQAFKELYGVDFNPASFKPLSEASKRLDELNSYTSMSSYLGNCIEKLDGTVESDTDIAVLLSPMFGNDFNKSLEYVQSFSSKYTDRSELKTKLQESLQVSKAEADKQLSCLNREEIESSYKSSYKKAMGDYKSDEVIAGYIEQSKMNAMLTETGLVISASLLTMGSSTVLNLSSKAVTTLGTKVGGQVVKAGMTMSMASLPAVETVVGGLTSKEGLTVERGEAAWEELKNGLMYGAFGAYVSGPLGNLVSKVLSKNPQIFSQIISSHKFTMVAGTATETTADVLFDRITSDLSFKESMAQNGIMNFAMMFVGSKINKSAQLPDISEVTIEKMKDGSYNLKANNRVFLKVKNDNELAVVTLALGVKSEATAGVNRASQTEVETPNGTHAGVNKTSQSELENPEVTQTGVNRVSQPEAEMQKALLSGENRDAGAKTYESILDINQDLFEDLVKERTIDYYGNEVPRFSDDEIEKLVNLSKEYPDQVQALLEEKKYYGTDREVPRFTADDIEKLVISSKDNRELVQDLINAKTIDYNGREVWRFSADEIEKLVNLSKEYPDQVQALLKEKVDYGKCGVQARFTADEIEKLVISSKDNRELVQALLKERMIDYYLDCEVPRFSADGIEKLVNLSKDNPKSVQYLLKETMIEHRGREVPRFRVDEIEKLVNLSKDNSKIVQYLLEEKVYYSSGIVNPRFRADEIEKLVNLSKEYPKQVQALLKEKVDYGSGIVNPRFRADEIEHLVNLFKKYPKQVQALLKETEINSFGKKVPRFNACEIMDLANLNNPALIQALLKETKINSFGKKVPRFSAIEIKQLVYLNNSELVLKLVNAKTIGHKWHKVPRFSAIEIKQLVYLNNSELVLKLVNAKTIGHKWHKVPRFSAVKIENLAELAKTPEHQKIIQKLIDDKKYDILDVIDKQNIKLVEPLSKLPDFPPEKIEFALKTYSASDGEIAPEIFAAKMQTFFKLELGDNLIQNIAENAKTLSVFNEEICTILKEKQEQGTDVNELIKAITGDIPEKLGDKIDALTSLVSLTPDEIKVFEKQGVDINAKIELLEKAVNAKTPTISTTQEGRRRFLKGLANNTQADAAIQNADFEQFGKQGIPLKYSREEFMHNMNALIAEYNNAAAAVQSDFKVPELKLTDEEINTETKAKIEELKQKNQSQNVEVIFEDGTHQATRFLGTQGGSNEAYFTQIGDKLYYIKYPKQANLGQSIEEVLAADLYRAAGIESPNMKLIYNNNGDVIGMASEYVPGMKMPEDKTVLYDSYAVDAWLANWDAPKNDNTQVFRNGTVIKSDVGGSLNYRARGGVKTNFGSTVDELVTLLEQNSTYSSMTKEELLKSIEHVTSIPDAAIRKMVMDSPIENTSIANTLIDRKKYLSLFSEKLKTLDESQFKNIYEMLLEAKKLTNAEFEKTVDIGELFGYTQTKTGFEGLLNTRDITELNLTTEQRRIAERMQEEIRKFTLENSVADGVNLSHETKEFLNSVLKGVPEFAAYFSKPQHDTQKYSLDIHILKVLQDSMNDPMYKELGYKDKIVLKFSALLHDIGKRYLGSSSDTGHAVKSAEYVYSILDRFNLDADVKDRIIQTVNNHHWFKEYNTGVINEEMVATYCRRPEDFKIFQIMAKADLKNVNDGYYQSTLEAKSVEEADKIFAEKMKAIQVKVDELQSKKVAITASRFREVPERVTSDGRVLEARQIPRVTKVFNGEDTEFKVLNMTELSPDTDMYQYGFNHITLEDLKFLVHMPGDYGIRNFNIFKTLGQNPMNNSVQSISMISMADKATYCSRQFGLILDVDNSNVGHAYYANTASGTSKGLVLFKEELFENSEYRSFVKDQFKEWVLTNKGVELSDEKYGQIMKYITGLKYPETQIKDGVIDGFSKEELLGAFTFSRNQLNEMKKEKTHGSHNEIVGLQPKIRGVVAKVASLDECPDYVLQFAKENDLPIFLVGN